MASLFNLTQGHELDERGSRERLANILSDQKRIGSIIQERTALPDRGVRAMFREARTIDSTFAAGCGIVNEIRRRSSSGWLSRIPIGIPALIQSSDCRVD